MPKSDIPVEPHPLPNCRKFLGQVLVDLLCCFLTLITAVAAASLVVAVIVWLITHLSPSPILSPILQLLLFGIFFVVFFAVMAAGVRFASVLRSRFGVDDFWQASGNETKRQ